MKVLIVINELNIRGGTHKQVLRLCEYLSKDNEVTIYTRMYDNEKTYPGFKKFNIVTPNIDLSSKKTLLQKIKKHLNIYKEENRIFKELVKDVDVVNIHDYKGTHLAKIAKKYNKKVVLQLNDIPYFFLEGAAKGTKDNYKFKLRRFNYLKLIKYVDEITVNVTKNKELVKKCLNRNAKVFYCGVDTNENLEKHKQLHARNKLNLFSSGVFFPYRNYETLVKVVDKIVKNGIDVHLDIMGSTEIDKIYANSIKKMINDMKLDEYITIWGQVDEEKYIELHNNADMFLFININQSWGLAVFEAMSCGLPVIVSNSVGAIELLTDKENAVIVDPENVDEVYNEIIKLKDNKEYYEKISNNADKIVKEFTWDNLYSSKMLELFKKISEEK